MQKRQLGKQYHRSTFGSHFFWKGAIALLCVGVVILLIRPYAHYLQSMISSASKGVVNVVSDVVGTSMKTDQYGNVNAALIGYGGGHHGGGYLADTIIIASRNPKLGAVSLVSIPRDLYIKNPIGGASRINATFSQIYAHHKKDLSVAATQFLPTLEKITGLEIPYYATIDFSGFKKVIDTLGGIEINVPSALHDYQYPDEALRGYDPLHIEAGWQHMDGALALKYARSRHAAGHASDFDRSLRQQLVIDAIKNKLLSSESLSLERVKQLYADFTTMVTTNVALDEMLWTIQYLDGLKMFSFGINNYYNPSNPYTTHKGAFLYNPSREQFGGASVMIPFGASAGHLDNYQLINEYVDFITHMQGFLLEGARIGLYNGISKEALRAQGLQNAKIANRLGTKMKRYGIEIVKIENIDPQETTQVVINTSSSEAQGFEQTILALKNFLPIDEVVYNTGVVKMITDDYGNQVEVFTGTDIEVRLGASYLVALQENPFSEHLLLEHRSF